MISPGFEIQRRDMVERQLVPRGISNQSVLDAFLDVPRERFILSEHMMCAYEDHPLPICCGQTISQPYMAALMTELVYTKPPARALDVGTGSGYQTAILARLGFEVVSIERMEELAKFAEGNMVGLPYASRVRFVVGDGSLGFPEAAPFDLIIVSGACPKIPPALIEQLAPSGKLTIPCGPLEVQRLLLGEKDASGGEISITEHTGCRFVPLIGKDAFEGGE